MCGKRNHRSYTSHTRHGTYLASNFLQNRVQGDEGEEKNADEALPGGRTRKLDYNINIFWWYRRTFWFGQRISLERKRQR